MARSNLPQELWIEILSRLPAKSVGMCRCLGKQWRALLSTPEFIKTHLNLNTHVENLILIAPSRSLHTIAAIKDGGVSKKLESPDNWKEIVGSCHGLVLLMNQENEKILLNPITQQQLKIPDCPLALKREESFSMHGFGYDSLETDYKIVTLSYYRPGTEFERDCKDTFVDVYSVKRGVWKRVDNSPYNHADSSSSSGAFVNGAIHWLAKSREPGHSPVIIAFNFAREVFDEIPAPSDDDDEFLLNKLLVLGGFLCMMDVQNLGLDVWIMEEYGVVDSWTKLGIDADYIVDLDKPLCYIGDEEVVCVDYDCLTVYNMKDKSFKDMVVDGAPALSLDAGVFVESLVSPTMN